LVVSPDAFARIAELHRQLSDAYTALAQQSEPGVSEQRADDLLRIKEACARMKWTYSWAVKHWPELGGFKDADGGLKIRTQVLARHGWQKPGSSS
jgi:hypothetical protein